MILAVDRIVAAATIGLVLQACVGAADQTAGNAQSAAASQTKTQPVPKDIDGLLAPIALYPDQLLAQMLLCSTDPDSVRRLHEWLKTNQALKGSELQDAAVVADFEPSFVALAVFPQVVQTMAERLDWTTLVGQAFTADRSAVFDSIQKLRAQARNVGTLKSTSQQTVETQKTSGGQEVIVIEPANPQVVYVPQYNSTVVYTQAPPATTVVVQETSSADAVAAGLIGFTAGIAIGAAVNNNYYYGPYGFYGGAYMYNDAWDDYYDAREDAREDWMDHREDLVEERGDRAQSAQEQRTERSENRQENRPETQAQREQRRTDAQGQAAQRQTNAQARQGQGAGNSQAAATQARSSQAAATQARSSGSGYQARGHSGNTSQAAAQRSGTSSDAFSGYSSGRSERAASARGQQSRSSARSRSGGGGGRRR
jgi:hypothetical protein